MNHSPRFDTVLFDLDGTLIDSRADLVDAVNSALEQAGMAAKRSEEIIPHIGNGLKSLISNIFGGFPINIIDKGIDDFSRYYAEHCVDKTRLYEDVRPLMMEFSDTVKLGIVTNKPQGFAEKIVDNLGLGKFIPVIIGGDSYPERKPHPQPVFEAVKSLQSEVTSTLFLGDGEQDVKAGQAAGVKTCLAKYGYGYNEKSMLLNPTYSIQHFYELKEIVL